MESAGGLAELALGGKGGHEDLTFVLIESMLVGLVVGEEHLVLRRCRVPLIKRHLRRHRLPAPFRRHRRRQRITTPQLLLMSILKSLSRKQRLLRSFRVTRSRRQLQDYR